MSEPGLASAAPAPKKGFLFRSGTLVFYKSQITAVTATLLDLLAFLWVMNANPYIPAFAGFVGVSTGGLFAFVVNRQWSFRAAGGKLHWQALRWLIVWFGSAVLNIVLVVFLLESGMHPAICRGIVAVLVGVLFNFPLHRYFVFPSARPRVEKVVLTPKQRKRRALLWALRVVLFPWFFFTLSQYPARAMRELDPEGKVMKVGSILLGIFSYIVVAIPPTLVIFFEILITLNEMIIAEQADYRLQSDFEAFPNKALTVPGPKTPPIPAVAPSDSEAYYTYLVEKFSPVVVQKVSHHPEWDIPVFVDLDGTLDPYDNVRNEPKTRPNSAGVYGEVTAITKDSIYLTYSFYHVKDYDHPVREMLTRWTYHDNDNEGYHARVDLKTLKLASIETWFHNRFLVFNHTGESTGTDPVHGRIHTEGGTHPIIYVQPQGHGVRCAQNVDGADLTRNAKILRYRAGRDEVKVNADTTFEADGTYELRGFSKWYEEGALERIGKPKALFSETIVIGHHPDGSPLLAAGFISGEKFYDEGWSRPKPMWAWDDGWDEIPVFVWHGLPSLSFQSHEGTALSHDYEFSRPVGEMLKMKPEELMTRVKGAERLRRDDKWEFLLSRGGGVNREAYRYLAAQYLRRYVNYLFHALG